MCVNLFGCFWAREFTHSHWMILSILKLILFDANRIALDDYNKSRKSEKRKNIRCCVNISRIWSDSVRVHAQRWQQVDTHKHKNTRPKLPGNGFWLPFSNVVSGDEQTNARIGYSCDSLSHFTCCNARAAAFFCYLVRFCDWWQSV